MTGNIPDGSKCSGIPKACLPLLAEGQKSMAEANWQMKWRCKDRLTCPRLGGKTPAASSVTPRGGGYQTRHSLHYQHQQWYEGNQLIVLVYQWQSKRSYGLIAWLRLLYRSLACVPLINPQLGRLVLMFWLSWIYLSAATRPVNCWIRTLAWFQYVFVLHNIV